MSATVSIAAAVPQFILTRDGRIVCNCAMNVIFRTRCIVLAAVAIAFGSFGLSVRSAEEAHPLDDALLDPAGVLRPPPVDAEPADPLRQYVGDPFRFEFDEPREDKTEVQNGEPSAEEDPFRRSATEWDKLKVGELPTEEGAIIHGNPALLMAELANPVEPGFEVPRSRVFRWSHIIAATAVVLLVGALCWRRTRLRSHAAVG